MSRKLQNLLLLGVLVLMALSVRPTAASSPYDCPSDTGNENMEFIRQACSAVITLEKCTAYCKVILEVYAGNKDCMADLVNSTGTYDEINNQHRMEL